METLIIALKNEKARKLLRDLEELEIIQVVGERYEHKKSSELRISDLKNKIASPMNENTIDTQLREIRNEWQPII